MYNEVYILVYLVTFYVSIMYLYCVYLCQMKIKKITKKKLLSGIYALRYDLRQVFDKCHEQLFTDNIIVLEVCSNAIFLPNRINFSQSLSIIVFLCAVRG